MAADDIVWRSAVECAALIRRKELSPVELTEAVLARIDALVRAGRPYVTLMTGPSRTADIELTLTLGVHGPGKVIVVIGP